MSNPSSLQGFLPRQVRVTGRVAIARPEPAARPPPGRPQRRPPPPPVRTAAPLARPLAHRRRERPDPELRGAGPGAGAAQELQLRRHDGQCGGDHPTPPSARKVGSNTCNSIDWEVWYWPRGCHVGLYSGSEPTHPIPKTHPVNHTQRPLERKALLLYNRLGLRMDGYICSRFIPSHLKIGK